MQDDCYLIAEAGWKAGTQPREIRQVKNKEGKLVWPEKEDFRKGKRRFKSDLVPAVLVIEKYFASERAALEGLEAELAGIEQQLDEKREEQSGEDGLLAEVIEGEIDAIAGPGPAMILKIFFSSVQKEFAEERAALRDFLRGGALLRRFFIPSCSRMFRPPIDAPTQSISTRLNAAILIWAYSAGNTVSKTPKACHLRKGNSRRRPDCTNCVSSSSRGWMIRTRTPKWRHWSGARVATWSAGVFPVWPSW